MKKVALLTILLIAGKIYTEQVSSDKTLLESLHNMQTNADVDKAMKNKEIVFGDDLFNVLLKNFNTIKPSVIAEIFKQLASKDICYDFNWSNNGGSLRSIREYVQLNAKLNAKFYNQIADSIKKLSTKMQPHCTINQPLQVSDQK